MATFHKNYEHALVWFRRDLRDYDHAALARALAESRHVYCAFVFDTDILDALEDRADRRVEFIWESVRELKAALHDKGGDLIVLHGSAPVELPRLARNLQVQAVYANRDYEPAAVARDAAVADSLRQAGIAWHASKDQVIFEAEEVLSTAGRPYSVYTPYARQWKARLTDHDIAPHSLDEHLSSLAPIEHPGPMPSLESLGFVRCSPPTPIPPGMSGAEQLFENFQERLDDYHMARDFPAVRGPSYLSVHLRFGTLSIRSVVRHAWYMGGPGAETWLKEIIWREFYFMILHHHPRVAAGHSFKEEFDAIRWPGSDAHFAAWCAGRTGYPLVDAAMRQLNQTGYMHNRLRMLVASFLVKDLLIDWRRGEAWFARKLLDFDFAANNGGWQWAASTGCDTQPWFRIFNPVTQSEKFDPHGRFIRKYVPELARCSDAEIHAPWKISATRLRELGLALGEDYPLPLVDHATQRTRALALYKAAS